ncbi:MAG TPA: VWA domain-containing protein, partial [Bdellovibrionota bacterium]|nr:VWA domain-containing protein [Bdellovibrionota bacterium]
MKFASPAWLWALAALPLAYLALMLDEKRRRRQFERFAAQDVWAAIAPEADWNARKRKGRIWILGMAFVLLAMARPQWGSHEEVVHVSGLDIMVVMDVSNSMEVEDVVPNRLKKAKHLVRTLVERLKGDRVGTVAFAGSSFLSCPLTTDLGYLIENMSILSPKMVVNQGTDVGIGIDTARKALERGAEEIRPGSVPGAEASAASSRVIILISDGEDHEEGALQAARLLAQSGIKFYVIGVGTEKGGPIPVRDDAGNLVGYKRDRSGQPVVSSFKPDALMQVASSGAGRYFNATGGEEEISEILHDMGALSRSDYAERRYLVYEDRFQIPLALGIMLLLLELSIPARRLRRHKIGAAAAMVLYLLLPASAEAAPLVGKQPPLEVYLDNEKGVKAFKKGDVEAAKREFGTAQAKDPTIPELQYNRGVVQLQEGDVESSVQAFSDAARSARQNPGGPDEKLAGQSFYNLGGALSKKGDVKGAIGSYLEAIGSARRTGDVALENDARKNIELLIRQQQQQKQKQKQDQQQKNPQDQKDQEKQDQNQQSNQDQEKQKQQQQQQAQKYKEQPRKNFKSEKLSPEDAERV